MNKETPMRYILLFISILLLSSCQTNKSIRFPQVTEVKTVDFYGESFGWYAISSNGQYFYTDTGGQRNIESKEIIPLDNFFCSGNAPIRLSPNGLYLSGSTNYAGMGIYDIQEKNCFQPQDAYHLNPVESWSSESNRFVLAQSRIVMDYPSFNRISYPSDYPVDFRNIKNIYGSSNILWNKESNLPIAEVVASCDECVFPLDANFPNLQAKTYLEIRSLDIPEVRETTTPIRENLLTFDWITGINYSIFDPTGEYILVAVEERTLPPIPAQEMTPQQKYEYYYDSKYVKDTILILVHWRTKEHVELLRLSQYGQVQSDAILSEMSWSADGSTILIPRKNEPPLVLKMKYP